jgi:ATP-dependent RNA helicase DDX60
LSLNIANAANAVQDIAKVLTATQLPIKASESWRSLPFPINTEGLSDVSKPVSDHRLLQLEHGDPGMDRRFDSQPDARVPFEPDTWQRDVLNPFNANESVLVIAPTSAGKHSFLSTQ